MVDLNKTRLYAYKQSSESSKVLAEALGIKRLRHVDSKWNPEGGVVINWGSSYLPPKLIAPESECEVVNHPYWVSVAVNKRSFLIRMQAEGLNCIPEWTTDPEIASLWLTEGHTVVCRENLTGHSGEGITLVSKALLSCDDEDSVDHGHAMAFIPQAPLYTKYQKKTHEFRIHIVDGQVIDLQQKKRKKDVPDSEVNWSIRNLAGGFIYAREGVTAPQPVLDAALESFKASGLDFGAVDVIWHEPTEKAVVLEINTACGLQSPVLIEKYSSAIKELVERIEVSVD